MGSNTYDVKSTAEHIENMATTLGYACADMNKIALKMKETNNLDYAGEATARIVNLISNLRLDLLVTRPLRETMRVNP